MDSSLPTMVAGISVPWEPLLLLNTTVTELAVTPLSLTTCALVRIWPSVETTKPVPMPCCSPVDWPHMSVVPGNVDLISTTPAMFCS